MQPSPLAGRARTIIVLSTTALTVALFAQLHGYLKRLPPTLRGHALAFQRMDGGLSRLQLAPLAASSVPAVLLVGVGRGDINAFSTAPAATVGVRLDALGRPHTYARWPNSGTATYYSLLQPGTHAPTVIADTPPADEVTVAAVQIDGSRVQDHSWVERRPAWKISSGIVTTTGPATLVAFWWGDAGVRYRKHVLPGNGFKLLGGVLESGALVQSAVAVRHVQHAGTYDMTWTAWPKQGGQVWLIAVE
jgi:hypothetical protein